MPNSINAYNGPKNQLTNGQYDAAGNQQALSTYVLTYDAENRQVKVTDNTSGNVTTYSYDGTGHRVMKVAGSVTTVYVHDVFGNLAAKYTTGALPTQPCTTCYLSWDQLGSTRMVTGAAGAVVARHDYLPFGVEIPAGSAGRTSLWGTTDNVAQKFTGQERDGETGFDFFGARYMSSVQARWASPDLVNITGDRLLSPSSTLNKYVYGGNNPLKYVDPDGKDITVLYEQGDPTGHVMLSAYNQQTGDFAFMSVGPQKHLDPAILTHPFEGVPGTSEFRLPQTADDLRQHFAALTIQTSPEIAQEAIDAIRNGAGTGNWALLGNNCTSACAKVLKDIGVKTGSKALAPWTPDKFWNNLNLLYGKSASRSTSFLANTLGGSNLIQEPPKNGVDYGSPRYGMNTFDWLMLMLTAPLQECVSVSDSGSGSAFGSCK